ncbi:hypothetical protein [Sediminibacterium sp.]|uniref:hypothetical protein n=1 Tax=Sediminibacterium sp. TaxID=1917865 RepID=UPI0025FC63C9|nr:hypothetical protein [Sediminibacterium sp.]MBW0176669.1 hypothetical protein [Sediminibacterium sp.]
MIEWRFKPNSRDDMDVDPIQGEFFTTRDIDNISTAVVREGIQNALDERNRADHFETVRVRIFLSGNKYALQPQAYLPFLETLTPHLKAKASGISALPDFETPMKFLVFEDFNTKGLEGNPKEHYVENIKDGQPHNFYYFWRNVGRSGKIDDKLGRWGLGKTVFPASSNINSFWGITVRKSDRRKMLMGQSILRIHNREDEKKEECGYKPYGMFGKYEGSTDCFAEPVETESELNCFESLFHLQRKDQPGFSLIVPFVTDEITVNHLAYAVIEQYFYPILEGRLEVEITEEDHCIELKKDSIRRAVEQINFLQLLNEGDKKLKTKESLIRLFEFAQWSFGLKEEDFFRLKELDLKAKPRWNSKAMFGDQEGLNLLRDRFEQNERVAFSIPLKYQPVNGEAKTCWYQAFLEKDTTLVKPENLFVRDGITISGITSLDKGLVRGVVVIQDIDLARMLGDSENPAHTEWQPDSRNFKGKYVDGKEALAFVKATLKKLYDQLQRPLDGIQKDLLIDFFSIPVETQEPEEKKPKDKTGHDSKGEDDTEEPDIPIVQGKKRPVLVEKILSGLKITSNPAAEEMPESMRLKLGYDVPRGNPIKSYQQLDFDLSKLPIIIESTGVYFTKKEKNELEFEIENKEQFEIQLTGFDEKRDLFLKLQ